MENLLNSTIEQSDFYYDMNEFQVGSMHVDTSPLFEYPYGSHIFVHFNDIVYTGLEVPPNAPENEKYATLLTEFTFSFKHWESDIGDQAWSTEVPTNALLVNLTADAVLHNISFSGSNDTEDGVDLWRPFNGSSDEPMYNMTDVWGFDTADLNILLSRPSLYMHETNNKSVNLEVGDVVRVVFKLERNAALDDGSDILNLECEYFLVDGTTKLPSGNEISILPDHVATLYSNTGVQTSLTTSVQGDPFKTITFSMDTLGRALTSTDNRIELEMLVQMENNMKLSYYDYAIVAQCSGNPVNKPDEVLFMNEQLHLQTIGLPADSLQLNSSLGGNQGIGEVVTVETRINMPFGMLSDFSIDIEFKSDISPVPISMLSGQLDAPSYIVMSNPNKKDITGGGFEEISSRKRRAVALNNGYTLKNWYIGEITNPKSSGNNAAPLKFTVSYVIPHTYSGNDGGIQVSGIAKLPSGPVIFASGNSTFGTPQLEIFKTMQVVDNTTVPHTVRFNVTVSHAATTTAPAYDITIYDAADEFDIFFYKDFQPGLGTPGLRITNKDKAIAYELTKLDVGAEMFLSYEAIPSGDGRDLVEFVKYYNASFVFRSAKPSTYGNGNVYTPSLKGPLISPVCVNTTMNELSNLFLNHGFTALLICVGVLVGFVLTIVVIVIIMRFMKQGLFADVRPASAIDNRVRQAGGRGLIMDPEALGKGGYTIQSGGMVGAADSIIIIITMKDKLQCQRELDNLDIQETIEIDQDIEKERNNATKEATVLLVQSMRQNNDITKQTEDKCLNNFQKVVKDLEKRMESEYKTQIQDSIKLYSIKNKERMTELLLKQEKELKGLRYNATSAQMDEKELMELTVLIQQQHETEQNELKCRLKLEQDEDLEKLRKEHVIRHRMALKESQQQLLKDVIDDGKLVEEQADWLIKEHMKNQSNLETLYDDEISKQRMALEEKLARRRALAAIHEQNDDNESDLLNTLASQQLKTIQKAKKESSITQEEAERLMEQVKDDMMKAKEGHDKEREKQEAALQKTLTERKKKRMNDLKKQHQLERDNFQREHKNTSSIGTDTIDLIVKKQQMFSCQRAEMNDLENTIDTEQAEDLSKVNKTITKDTEDNLKDTRGQLLDKLKKEGVSQDQLKKILAKHEKEVTALKVAQEEEKNQQEINFRKKLAKQRKAWSERKEQERLDQERLREHEEHVVHKLIASQSAMSEEERERILKEHEKQMVKLENSLTLNKLQQKRKFEEKLAQKREAHMQKLEKKQNLEKKKQEKSQAKDSDAEEDEKHTAQIELMKKHAKQKIAVLEGEKLKLDDELEEIRVEMMQERAMALKSQEERLGALMATLQMEKAKEMVKIEEQQKAIHNLKSNLMDDLNERGVLSDPECQRVIETHQKNQEVLQEKLEAQRLKQEKLLRKRMSERLMSREATMVQTQERELSNLLDSCRSKSAARIKRAMLVHKHTLQMEQFRNRMEKELSQTVEDMRRQNKARRLQVMQEQEMQFMSGLIRLGKLKVGELLNVLGMLFPRKSGEELDEMIRVLFDGDAPPPEDNDTIDSETDMLNQSTLGDRIRAVKLSEAKSTPNSSRRRDKHKKKKKGHALASLKSKQYNNDEDAFDATKGSSLPPLGYKKLSERPDPLGRSETPEDYDDDNGAPRRLRPISGKKKKKKVTEL
ncbi:unnamed protein product [Owenia fusiformis]|uniref:Uncharacterized protein n=1 Tax=Owenia fusiformis TaxID=6347 RepID=A0A8S4NM65_OWEFU|nr:unnamed protein product [Owenia fusiformis]